MKTLHLSIIAVLIIGTGVAYAYSSAGFPETHYAPTNDTKLELLVMNSTEFKERTTGNNYTLAGVDYNWIPKARCTVPNNVAAQGNVEVQSGSNVLTIPSGVKLTIPFATNHLQVDTSTGLAGVLIKHGGTISSH